MIVMNGGTGSDESRYVPASVDGWPDPGAVQPSRGQYVPGAECSSPNGPAVTPSTVAEVQSLMVGRWLVCSTDKMGADPAHAGVDIFADGRFDFLVADATSGIVPATDIADSGVWSVPWADAATGFQVNFDLDEGISYILLGSLTEPPLAVKFDNNGVYTYRYVRVSADGGAP
jgi:hypothetical protein